MLSKINKPDNFESHNPRPKLLLLEVFAQIFVHFNSFLGSNSPNILALCETNFKTKLTLAISLLRNCLYVFVKNSVGRKHGLTVYVKEGLPFTPLLVTPHLKSQTICFEPALLYSVT